MPAIVHNLVAARRGIACLRPISANCGARSRTYVLDTSKGRSMNWDRIEGNWKQMKGSIKEKWGKLTDDEFDTIAGKRDKLIGKIQERYGVSHDEADAQVKIFENEYDTRH
jgi:uncharacterized protein YjbJ (UPF0337 family)